MGEKHLGLFRLAMYLASHIDDLRIEGKYETADTLREWWEMAFDRILGQSSVKVNKAFRDGYRVHRNMPDATLAELENF